jgi:pyridoxamine 5'-phosphate oxidase
VAALLFHWDREPIGRQIRIEGVVTHASDAESDAYWQSRPRESQINAWASQQSRPVADRAALQAEQDRVTARFDGAPVPRPTHWGGYRVSLDRIEFWQGDKYRLHDRVVYVRSGPAWSIQRLSP